MLPGAAFLTAGSGPIAAAYRAKYGVAPIAIHNHRFVNRWEKALRTSERAFTVLIIWNSTRVVKAMDCAWRRSPVPSTKPPGIAASS